MPRTSVEIEISAKPTSRSSAAWAIAFQPGVQDRGGEHQDDDERAGVEVQRLSVSVRTG